MGSITTGIGLISGIDIASLIDSIITLESGGKFRLQDRLATLQTQQTALLDVNARLLAFKSAASSFRVNNIFNAALATSADETVLTASATTNAQPGTFDFIVKQLVSTSQQLSGGFATSDANPLGLDSIAFEFGNGRLNRDRDLEELNGGAGADRGSIQIQDRAGTTATIDLTDAITVGEVVQRINDASGLNVTASISNDHLVLTDTVGGAGTLTVSEIGNDTTAADLGIKGNGVGNVLTGTPIFSLGSSTALKTVNDGNGVLVRNNVPDLSITARDGTVFTVDLGRIDLNIDDTTLLSELNDGAGVTIDGDTNTPDIRFVARDGTGYDVDLTGVTTVGGLRGRISNETGAQITLQVEPTGDRFRVVDNSGGGGLLKIEGAGPNGTSAANDLGILNEAGVNQAFFVGTVVPSTIDKPTATTIQEVIDRINGETANGGRVVASIDATGNRLKLLDTTGQTASNLIVASTAGNPFAAGQLGIAQSVAGTTITGARILAGLDTVLTTSINGGSGLTGATDVTFTDRANNSFTLMGIDQNETIADVINAINTEAGINGVQITASLNDTGNGLKITDTSLGSGNLIISALDNSAKLLGIEANVAANSVVGKNVQLQYVSSATKLTDMNNGRGIAIGSFRITDGLGQSAVVDIGGTEDAAQDVIDEINSKGLAVKARINDNGDGIIVEEDAAALGGQTPFVNIQIDAVGGSTAADLNLLGVAANLNGGFIDGSYERVVDLNTGDTLDEAVTKINDAGIPVSASVLNTSSGATPFRLNLTSGISGRAGDLVIDTEGVDIGLTALADGRDARVFFGAKTPADGFLVTSPTNTLDQVLSGVTIDLLAASSTPVAVTVARDTETITGAVSQFVSSFNDVITNIDKFDFFNVDTEERGPLLGNPTTGQVRDSLFRLATGTGLNTTGSLRFLTDIGISFDGNGQMIFDETRFAQVFASSPQDVEELLAAYDVTTGATTQVVQGVTISNTDTTFNRLGIANRFDVLLDDLTNSVDGTVTRADDAFGSQIDLINDRIDTIDDRLADRRAQLTRQFTAMEEVLARLQSQSATLASLGSGSLLSTLVGR